MSKAAWLQIRNTPFNWQVCRCERMHKTQRFLPFQFYLPTESLFWIVKSFEDMKTATVVKQPEPKRWWIQSSSRLKFELLERPG